MTIIRTILYRPYHDIEHNLWSIIYGPYIRQTDNMGIMKAKFIMRKLFLPAFLYSQKERFIKLRRDLFYMVRNSVIEIINEIVTIMFVKNRSPASM